MKNTILILGLLSFSGPSYAEGGMASGGGKGIVCFDNEQTTREVKLNNRYVRNKDLAHITKIEMLDLNYARSPQGLNRKTPTIIDGNDFIILLEKMINRVELTIPILGKELRRSEQLFDNNIFFRNFAINKTDDENDVALNENDLCVLTTLAKQYKDNGEYFIHIDERLFFHETHSEVSKATLLFHEYLYALAISKGEVDSRSVREVVSLFVKNDKDIKIIDIVKKVFKSNLTPFRPTFKTIKDDRRINHTLSQSIDYTLFTMPMNFMFDWIASLYTKINRIINNFDDSRPEGINSLKEIIKNLSQLLHNINITKKIEHISEAKTLLSKYSQALLSAKPIRYKNIINEVRRYNKARETRLKNNIIQLIDNQKDLIIDYELKDQGSLTKDQVDALFIIIKKVAYDRIKLLKSSKATSMVCGLNHCSGKFVINQDTFLENLTNEQYLKLSAYTSHNHKRYKKNIKWIRSSIYKAYHELKIFDLNNIYMQQL